MAADSASTFYKMSISPTIRSRRVRHSFAMAFLRLIGGRPKNWHGLKRRAFAESGEMTEKTPVISLISKETGEARSRVVQNVDTPTMRKLMADHMDMASMILFTDESHAYNPVSHEFAVHERVNHSIGEYARRGDSTNAVEGYFSQLKRSLDGTHHHVSPCHLSRYTGEFDFRYSTRKFADSERAVRMIERAENKRLTYDRLIGRGVRRPLSGRGSLPTIWG